MYPNVFQKKTIRVFLCVGLFVSLAGSAFAAWQPFSATMSVWVGQVGGPCSADGTLIAQNGDVVTTDKWNQLACQVRNTWYLLTDGMRGETFFINGHNDTPGIGGKPGYIVDEINLPTKVGIARNTWGGAIHFKDSTKSYGDNAGYGGGIIYGLTAPHSLDLYGFSDGLKISGTYGWVAHGYLVGWEKVNLYDTAAFDPSCQYRFRSNVQNNRYYYASTVDASTLNLAEDGDWGDATYGPVFLQVSTDQKTVLKNEGTSGSSWAVHGNMVSLIEKYCLPSYNPNNF